MKNWLVKKLGGHTHDEYLATREGFNRAVRQMLGEKRAVILDTHGPLARQQCDVDGLLFRGSASRELTV